jgi:hypothetical protein
MTSLHNEGRRLFFGGTLVGLYDEFPSLPTLMLSLRGLKCHMNSPMDR